VSPNWPLIVRKLADAVRRNDAALLLRLDGESFKSPPAPGWEGGIVATLPEQDLLSLSNPGKKAIGKWLWSVRETRAFRRPHGCIWMVRLPEKVIIGAGAVVPTEVLAKMKHLAITEAA
jgi:hypothetical protein